MCAASGGTQRTCSMDAASGSSDTGRVPETTGRPGGDRQICNDCGRDLDPADARDVQLATVVMKVCPRCFAVREELDQLLG
jgi:hypothetical protein